MNFIKKYALETLNLFRNPHLISTNYKIRLHFREFITSNNAISQLKVMKICTKYSTFMILHLHKIHSTAVNLMTSTELL